MKNFKNFISIFLIVSILSMNAGVFVSPVFAFEKKDVNFEQNENSPLSKINKEGSYIKKEFKERAITNRQIETGLSKNKVKSLENSKSAERIEKDSKNYVEGEVLVKFKEQKINLEQYSGRVKARQFATNKNLDKKEDIRKSNISILKTKGNESVENMIERLKNDSRVEYVEPNYIQPWTSTIPNDTDFGNLWGLHNITEEADIDATEAWDIFTGSNSVVVAVLDSGIAYNHPDLKNNMWDGTAVDCKNENNQSISCPNHGWDYTSPDNNPIDDNGHGTHVAGTIGAQGNNSIGVTGVNWDIKLMALKVGDYKGAITGDVVKAIDFAINNNVKIINASFGGPESTQTQSQYDAIDRFRQAGGIFITSAGNGDEYGDPSIGDNHDESGISLYPCDYDIDNIICVAATDQNDDLASFSDYGSASVDVGAPGVNIYSTINEIVMLNETFESATPPNVSVDWIKEGTPNYWGTYDRTSIWGSAWGKVLYGDLNYPYVNNTDSIITSPIVNLSGSNVTGATIDFWNRCDTEYNTSEWTDYMMLEFSSDGVNFNEINSIFGEGKWDEPVLDLLNQENPLNDYLWSTHNFTLSIPSNYLTNNFKFRFKWHTNFSDNYYDGCAIDDIKITKYTDGSDEQYGYKDGTSMAAPHVAGLAGLILGYKPDLTYAQVKHAILSTGDDLSSLSGKTVTGKRNNAYNALVSLVDSSLDAIKNDNFANQNVPVGATEVKVGSAIITAGDTEGITVTSINIDLSSDEAASIINLKLKDDQGNQIGDVEISPSESNIFLVDYEINVSESKIIDLYADINNDANTGLWNASFMAEGIGILTGDSVNSSSVELQDINFVAPALITVKNDDFEDQDLTVSSNNVKIGSAIFSANETEDINVTSITVNLSDTEAGSITNLALKDDQGVHLSTIKTTPSVSNDFLINFTIQKDEFKIVDIYADINNDAILGEWNADLESEGISIDSGTPVSSSNITLQTMNLIEEDDTTPPNITGLSNDDMPTQSKIWNWDSIDSTAKFRYAITQAFDWVPVGDYSDIKTATQNTGDGIYWLHVQAIDDIGNESGLTIVSAILDNISPIATLSGTPPNPTNQTTTDITVGNAVDTEAVTHYRYKLDEGDYSEIEIFVSEHIQLSVLSNGEYTLYVIGRDVAENWQSEASATIHTWTVDIIAPIVEETAPVITPTSDTRPDVGITVEDGASWEIKNVENILETGVGTGAEQIITLPELGEGTYNLILIATDDAGNITTINLSEFIIDLSVSPISLSNLPNNPTSETITDIVVSGDDIVFYKYKLDDDLDYSEEISIDTNIVLSSLSESEHTLSVIGRDEAGNWSDEISETWTIDLTAPNNPVIISPAEAIILNFDTYSITGTAEDGSLVEIYSGVELVGSQQLVIGETVYSIEVDLAQNADNNFTATATDLAGNKSASVIVPTITEDSIAPVVAIISPANGLITNQNPITFNWTVDGEIGSEEIPLTEGENVLTKEAVDEAGNVGSDSIIVILDTIAPILTEIAPVQTTTNNNTPEYIFNSTETGTIIYSGGCASATTDAIAGDNTITFDELDDGTYSECIITVTDAVGNESLPLQVSTFTIDTVAPIIIITSPEDGFITNQSTITIEFTEDGHPGSRDEILSEGENLVVVHGPEDEAGNRGEDSITVILDTIPPVISECMPVYTPTMDSTPDWAFDGEPGIISYSGSCSSVMTEAIQGENTITFNEMEDGVYNDCRIIVTDGAGNPSDLLTISEFTIDNVIPVITLLGSNPVNLYVGDSYEEAGATATDNVGITNEITIDSSAVDTSQTGTYEVSYNVSDNAGNSADEVIRTVIVDEVAVLTITVDPTQTEVVITSNQPTSIIIPDNVTNATINVDSLIADDGTSATATLPGINLNVDTSISETPVEVAILAGTIVSAPTRWNGIINAPKIEVNSSVSVTPDSGYTSTVSSVIEIGYGDTELTFDKAVRFLIPSSAGKYVGYSRSGTFTQITNVCSADTQTAGNALVAGGNCKIDVGSDLVIWTKHFTKFATYTQTAIQSTSPPSGGGGVSDRTAPSISKIEVTSTSTEATIIWKTNESSISWIVYGTSADYGLEEKTTVYTTSHSIKISDLLPGTTYHYQIKSKDRSGNKGEYTDKSFVAGGANVADINNDSKVDKYDFSMMMASWGKAGSNSSDLNNDNKVDKYDFALLMSNWGAK